MEITKLCLINECPLPVPAPVRVKVRKVMFTHSHTMRRWMEAMAGLWLAWETTQVLFAVLMISWAAVDFYCLIEKGEESGKEN